MSPNSPTPEKLEVRTQTSEKATTYHVEIRDENDRHYLTVDIDQRSKNDSERVNLVRELRSAYPNHTVQLLKRRHITMTDTVPIEAEARAFCPCNSCRNSISIYQGEDTHRGYCSVFRPQDRINNTWRSELTDLPLARMATSREDLEELTEVALLKHDASYGGYENARATVEAENEQRKFDRKVEREASPEGRQYIEEQFERALASEEVDDWVWGEKLDQADGWVLWDSAKIIRKDNRGKLPAGSLRYHVVNTYLQTAYSFKSKAVVVKLMKAIDRYESWFHDDQDGLGYLSSYITTGCTAGEGYAPCSKECCSGESEE